MLNPTIYLQFTLGDLAIVYNYKFKFFEVKISRTLSYGLVDKGKVIREMSIVVTLDWDVILTCKTESRKFSPKMLPSFGDSRYKYTALTLSRIADFGGNCVSNQSSFNNEISEEYEEEKKEPLTLRTRGRVLSKCGGFMLSKPRDRSSPKTLLEVRNNKVVNVFQEKDELEYAEPLDEEAKQVTYVVQRTLWSGENLVSKALVKAFNFPTEPHPSPYQIGRIKKGLVLMVTKICKVPLAMGKHYNELVSDVVDMGTCHVLLGRPWQHDVDYTWPSTDGYCKIVIFIGCLSLQILREAILKAIVQATNPHSTMKELKNGKRKRRRKHWRCEVNGKYDFKRDLYLFSWERRRTAMVPPKVTPQLPKPERKSIKDKVRREVLDVVEALDIENSRASSFQIRGIHVVKTKVNAVRDWSSPKTLAEVRNNKVAIVFQEKDELEYANPLDGEAKQVTYVI
nr:transposon Ty3-I Gag-Pol polyprotein [Tanacetum cinerariifolium]